MDLEWLTFPGAPARGRFRAAREESRTWSPSEISIEDEAAALSFHGSTAFSIPGTGFLPSNGEPAVTCRIYPARKASRPSQPWRLPGMQSGPSFQQPARKPEQHQEAP